jgi:predicted RNA binding protein YcfA (HicA-like mRNA interferase family)
VSDKDRYRYAEKRLEQAGFLLVRQNGHHIYAHADGRRMSVPSSPGEGRGWQNMVADLKRLGVPELAKRHEHKASPMLVTEEIGPAEDVRIKINQPLVRKKMGLQVSVMQVLVAQEVLRGNRVTDYGVKEKYGAVGKVLLRWLEQNPDLRDLAVAFIEHLQPDYETVFRGEFVCGKCGAKKSTPMARGRHESHCRVAALP